MGKWSKLKDTLVKFVQPDTWQNKIDKVKKEEYAKLGKMELCKEFLRIDTEKEKLKDQLSDLNTREEALNQLMVDFLETEGDSSVRNIYGTFFIKDDPYCSVTDKTLFNNWVKGEGMEDLFSVNYQTTAGLTKARLEAGQNVPPGITVFMKTSIGHRKSTD